MLTDRSNKTVVTNMALKFLIGVFDFFFVQASHIGNVALEGGRHAARGRFFVPSTIFGDSKSARTRALTYNKTVVAFRYCRR